MNNRDKQEMLAGLINDGEKDLAIKQLTAWSERTTCKDVILNILEPMLVSWGKQWMEGKLSLAHGYLSGKVAEEFYIYAANDPEFLKDSSRAKGTVILGNVEDDYHPLGRRLVAIFAQAAGWKIVDLGTDVPAETFVDSAIETNADIIAVSAMMFTTAKNILKIRQELDKRGLSEKISLAVGGAIFKLRPELVNDVGGDGSAETAIQASELFDALMKSKTAKNKLE